MCTVTYVPRDNHSYVLTSNRDEAPGRSPEKIYRGGKMIYPRDLGSGGTWICGTKDNRLVCILNGAFKKHKRQPPYRMSRGLMVLEYFSYKSTTDFFGQFDFTNIEPFTMVIFEGGTLYDYRWDGKKQYIRELNAAECHLWSSATLYDTTVQAKRKNWFEHWKQQQINTPEQILAFHTSAGDGDPWNDVVMNRNNVVRTVSITQVIKQKQAIEMHYFDLLRKGHDMAKMDLEGEKVVEST